MIKLGPLEIDPAEYASRGSAVLGIRDSGKSYTATLLAEQLLENGLPFVAFDPSGIWRYLRVPGKGNGYPVVVAGGEEADLALTTASAPAIVEAAMQHGISLVIDLFSADLSKADWKRIVRDCVGLLLQKNRRHGLRHIFLEEAAEFVPQRVIDGDVYSVVERLARIGGNAGLGYTLINQRSEEVNKAVLELCDNLFLHRQKGRNSLTSLSKWLDIGEVRDSGAVIKTLATLPSGECWAWLHGEEHATRIKVPEKNSLHPDRRARRGVSTSSSEAVDVASFLGTLRDALPVIEEKAKANDPALLRKRITELEKQVATKGGAATADVAAAEQRGYQRGLVEGTQEGRQAAWSRASTDLHRLESEVVAAITGVHRRWSDEVIAEAHAARMLPAPPAGLAAGLFGGLPGGFAGLSTTPIGAPTQVFSGKGAGAELRILKVLAQRHPARFSRSQWATLAGMSKTGGTWMTYLSRLRTAGYLEELNGNFGVTPAGMSACGSLPPAPSTAAEVVQMWKDALGGGAARMLDVLVAMHPHGLDRANLADRLGMTATGGTFSTYMSRLKTNGLIEVKGRRISANTTLFGG